VANRLTNPFSETTALQYDAAGRPVRQNNANGTYSTWAFDAGGQISNVATKKANDATILERV
jgi:YD repeat-containing protein